MKLIKKILYFIIGILMVSCVGILICALNPTLTGELAEQVQRLQGEPGGQGGEEAPPGVRIYPFLINSLFLRGRFGNGYLFNLRFKFEFLN